MFETSIEQHDSRAKQLAVSCLSAGLTSCHPKEVIQRTIQRNGERLQIEGSTFELDQYEDIYVLGGGNAAGHVAAMLESVIGDRITDGIVITDDPAETDIIEMATGSHPIPTSENREHAERLYQLADDADSEDLVLTVLTGGGSALMAKPVHDVTVRELQETTGELLESGATIDEINAVRKHLSTIKGGQLAEITTPATVAGLIFSDVVSDDPEIIASGPTAPDTTTYDDACHVLSTYDMSLPDSIIDHLEAGKQGDFDETPDSDCHLFTAVSNHILVTGHDAVAAAARYAEDQGINSLVLSSSIRGEAREAALSKVAILEEILRTGDPVKPPVAVVSGGETTVTVSGNGTGGPNQEFALSAALALPDDSVLASIDTDGIDGNTDAAGAIIDPTTVDDERRARAALERDNSHSYLDERDALLMSGPTGTNVNDLRIAIVGDL